MIPPRLLIVTLTHLLLPLLLLAQEGEEPDVPPVLLVTQPNGRDTPLFSFYEENRDIDLPLLPIIFFDHPGDTAIPTRYRLTTNASSYVDTADLWGQVDSGNKYYELLDIVGYRMRLHRATRITLKPGYSAEPGETPAVATARAGVIRDYLTSTWMIDHSRIAVATPERLSTIDDIVPLQEEARRVMIGTDDLELILPVRYRDRRRFSSSLPLNFHIEPNLPAGEVASIEIAITSEGAAMGRDTVPGTPEVDRYLLKGEWSCGSCDPRTLHRPITVEAIVTTRDGERRRSNVVDIKTAIRRDPTPPDPMMTLLRLPFFELRDSRLTNYHRMMLRTIIDSIAPMRRVILETWSRAEFSEDSASTSAEKNRQYREEIDSQPLVLHLRISSGRLRLATPSWVREKPKTESDRGMYDMGGGPPAQAYDVLADGKDSIPPIFLLPLARTTSVVDYVRDSLNVTLVNDAWDRTEMRTQRVMAYPGKGGDVLLRPEERWYGRYVLVMVRGEDAIKYFQDRYEKSMK